jgi:hypothetical protein
MGAPLIQNMRFFTCVCVCMYMYIYVCMYIYCVRESLCVLVSLVKNMRFFDIYM